MNNIPENENLNEQLTENTDAFEEDFSTVFSNPAEHKKTAENLKRKKLLPKVIACFLSVAILIGGTVAVIKLIPEKEDEVTSTPVIKDIEVLSLDSNEFKTVTVENNHGTFKLYSVEDKSNTTSSDSSEATKTVTWHIEGYKDNILSTSSIGNIASSIASLYATREVTELSATVCGLDKPDIKAVIKDNENKEITIILGKISPDKSGYYLKTSQSDKIYVVGSDVKDILDFTAVSLADTSILPAISLENADSKYKAEDGSLASFDKLVISGKNFSDPLEIVHVSEQDVAGFATYKIISPTRRVAENLDGVVEIFKSGVTVSGAYALDTNAKTLSSLGLNSPDFVATMKVGKESLTFKFKLQADGSYAAVSDGSVIVKKVEAEAIPFINYKTSNFYADWVCLNNISDLKGFTIKVDNTSYDFGIKANPDEEAEDMFIITYNGKTIKSDPFQSFYQDCISIKCADFTVDKVSGSPKYEMTFTYKDEIGGSEIVKFTKASETKYQYSVNGQQMGKVTASSLKAIENSLQNLIEGK